MLIYDFMKEIISNSVDIISIESYLCKNPDVQRWSESGWCRKWTDATMDVLEQMPDIFVKVEAREVEILEEYWHTFVAAETKDGEVYFFIQSWCKNNGYFGKESDAPICLKGNRIDSLVMAARKIEKVNCKRF